MDIADHINGKTKTFMLFGNPVEHSFSPVLQNTVAKTAGINSVYTAVKVDDIGEAVKGAYAMGIKGINVTVPYKQEVMKYLCGIDKTAQAIGAVNTLKYTDKGYYGYNTDMFGLRLSLKTRGIYLKNKTVVILGAGGAAKAAVALSLSEGAKTTYIINRTVEKAEAIKENALKYFEGEIICGDYDILDSIDREIIMIQTTSVGMGEGVWESPIKNTEIFKKTRVLMDIVYNPLKTKIMDDAESYGLVPINGLDMLIYQGMASFEIWNDMEIDIVTKVDLRDMLVSFYERGR
ncbi:MAG: shikimate dehydrogenase [Firmicutes bacterium]|nr:shikimate dehydrogenase [Bacillota bacterium]